MSFVDELIEMMGTEESVVKSSVPVDVKQHVARPSSPTALQIDTWGVERGKRLHDESERIRKTGCDPIEVADFFGAAFEYRPKLAESCVNPNRHAFMKGLLESPDYQALHKQTRNDEVASEIAATQFCGKFSEYDEENCDDNEPGPEGHPNPLGDIEREAKAAGAAADAVERAEKDIKDLNDLRGLGCGVGAGSGKEDPRKALETFQRVKNNAFVHHILNLAGKYRRLARSCQRQKIVHGMDDTVGVKRGDCLPLAIGSELAMLAMPELEDDVLQRMLEGQLIQYDRRAIEPTGKGPVFMYTDCSGSMGHNDRLSHARAIAITMAWIAKSQKRWCCLASFDNWLVSPIVFPPNWSDFNLLNEYIMQRSGGGTSLEWLADQEQIFQMTNAPRGRTDIIIVTDGQVGISDGTMNTFLQWKKANKCRLISMFVGCTSSGELHELSDQVFEMPDLSLQSEGVREAFSI